MKWSVAVRIKSRGSDLSALGGGEQIREVFLGILLASLGWLAHLLPNDLPFVVLVFFDGVHQSLTLFTLLAGALLEQSCVVERARASLTSSSANSA